MKVMYNITGAERKALVNAVSEVTGIRPQYQGVPRCGYQIGSFEIDKQGTLSIPADTDADSVERLLAQLAMKGFTHTGCEEDEAEATIEAAQEALQLPLALESEESLEGIAAPDAEPLPTEALESDAPREEAAASEAPPEEQAAFTIELPLEGFTDAQLLNLEKVVASKASLIKKALGVEVLAIIKYDNKLRFPWFRAEIDGAQVKAYTHFIAALCDMAKRQKRVIATEREVDSEKFAFRNLLIRLGFNGPEYADERKVLLRNLSGSCAFPNAAKAIEHTDRWNEKRRERRERELSNLLAERDRELENQPTQEGAE